MRNAFEVTRFAMCSTREDFRVCVVWIWLISERVCRDVISWFFPRCLRRKCHKWLPSPRWLVCVQLAAPRRTADFVTNMSVLISFDVAMHGVRVTCGDCLLLPLRSRLAVEKKISVSLS